MPTSTGNTNIHPSVIIDPDATVDPTTTIGPYCVIQGPVRIGSHNTILAHCFIIGRTTIGSANRIGPHTCIGTDPQSIGHFPDDTGVVIGDRNVIREFAQIHRSVTTGMPTRLGDGNFIMAGGHVAHDCHIGNECVLTNGAFISGHCILGDRVNISSPAGIHQFVRIGDLAMISAGAGVGMDVPPFMVVEGRNTVRALNVIGMRRAGIESKAREEIKRVYKSLYLSGRSIGHAVRHIDKSELGPEARQIIEFCEAKSRRGIMPHFQRPHARL